MIKLKKNLTQLKLNLVCTHNLDKNIVTHLTTDMLKMFRQLYYKDDCNEIGDLSLFCFSYFLKGRGRRTVQGHIKQVSKLFNSIDCNICTWAILIIT